jgi:hypothetical protein
MAACLRELAPVHRSSRIIGPDVPFRSLLGMTGRGASHTAVTRTPRSDSSAINCSSCAFSLSGSWRASFRYLRARDWSMATQLQRNRVWSSSAVTAFRSSEEQEPMFPVVRQSTEDPMIKKSTTIAIAVASTLLLPISGFAQGTGAGGTTAGGAASGSAIGTPNAGSAGAGTTGVSGIPAGPGSAGGTNNSVNDPSGIGNAAKVPPPATSPRGGR